MSAVVQDQTDALIKMAGMDSATEQQEDKLQKSKSYERPEKLLRPILSENEETA